MLTTIIKSRASKSLEFCDIIASPIDGLLILSFRHSNQIIFSHELHYETMEPIKAAHKAFQDHANILRIPHDLGNDWLTHFNIKLEEIIFAFDSEYLHIKSFVENEQESCLSTELSIPLYEFHDSQVSLNPSLTLPLREVRAVFALSEVLSSPLNCFFEDGGEPFLIESHSTSTKFECVFATVKPEVLMDSLDIENTCLSKRQAEESSEFDFGIFNRNMPSSRKFTTPEGFSFPSQADSSKLIKMSSDLL